MALSEAELEEQLKEAGNRLLDPPASVDDLLYLLDNIEQLLITVEQAPSRTIQDALLPPMKALISRALLRHSDSKVKISVASCLSEITRITAPDAPYNDDQMKEIFELTVAAFEKLTDVSGHDYGKAVSILDTVAKVRSCLVMLDLELDELVVDMFQLFLRIISSDQPPNVCFAMEKIMTLVIQESEDISLDLLLILLSSVKKEVQNQSPRTWKLGTKVITYCAAKLRPYLQEAVRFGYVALDEYGSIVSSICQEECNNSRENVRSLKGFNQEWSQARNGDPPTSLEHCSLMQDFESGRGQHGTGVGRKLKMEPETDTRKRGQKPNSLIKPEEKSGRKPRDRNCDNANGQLPDVLPLSTKRNPSGGIHAKKGQAIKKESNMDQDVDPYSLSLFKGVILGAHAAERGSVSDDASLKRKSKEGAKLDAKRQKQSRKHYRGGQESQHLKVERKANGHSTKSDVRGKGGSSVRTREAVLDEEQIADASSGKNDKSLKRDRSNSKESPKAESKRKHNAQKEVASEVPNLGELLIDKRIKVWWPMDKTFYEGIVTAYDPTKKRHTVLYTDGDQEVLNLKKQRWEMIENTTSEKGQKASMSKGKGSSDASEDAEISKAKKGHRRKRTADAKGRGLKAHTETSRLKSRIKSPAAGVDAKQSKSENLSESEAGEVNSEGRTDNPAAEVGTPKQRQSENSSLSESRIDNPTAEVDTLSKRKSENSGPPASEEADPGSDDHADAIQETGTTPSGDASAGHGNEAGSGNELSGH